MGHISAKVRLRPVRFAFLVRPNDSKNLLSILRINACLWGGKFNPIIPFLRQVPPWWDRHGRRFDTARQIVSGYLDAFEPDFLVEAERGLAQGLGFDEKRVLQLSDVLKRSGDRGRKAFGLDTFDLYRDLYLKEFQFERRHKHNIKHVAAEDPAFRAFAACAFGDFPVEKNLSHFKRAFKDAFDPLEVALDGASLAKLYGQGLTSVLDLGQSKIEVEYNDHSDPTLFVLDPSSPQDLIDFWNLRAFQREILAIPYPWLAELSDFCRRAIRRAFRPMPGNPHGVMLSANVMFARSIASKNIDDLYQQYIQVDVLGANCPSRLVSGHLATDSQLRRALLTANTECRGEDVRRPIHRRRARYRFDSIHPEFAARYGNESRWVNVVRLRDWSFDSRIATTLPTEYRDAKFSPFRLGGENFLSTTEGFVTFPRFRDIQHYWKLTDGKTAIAEWLTTRRVTAESVRRRQGDAANHSVPRWPWPGAQLGEPRCYQIVERDLEKTHCEKHAAAGVINKVNLAVKGDVWLEGSAASLVDRKAVELGLELKCSKCSAWSWYSLKSLDYKVNCSLCLREFAFPVLNPSSINESRWAYRLIGPFALPDYANGGYAASLAIRLFSEVAAHGEPA